MVNFSSEIPSNIASGAATASYGQTHGPCHVREAIQGGETEQWLTGTHAHLGRKLAYRLYVPPVDVACLFPAPLLVMLHGCGQSADDFATGTRMNALARDAGVLVLYPEQTQRANAQNCWNWFKSQHQRRGSGEPELLATLTRKVMSDYAADPQRVYVAGLSAGGAMAAILGHRYPELYAAVGVHSGLLPGAANDLPSALEVMHYGRLQDRPHTGSVLPLIVFHGDADDVVHPGNGSALVRAACEAQALNAPPQIQRARSDNGRSFTRTLFRHGDGASAVEHWQLCGGGHSWSGGAAQGSYTAPGGPDASAQMLRFFLSQQRVRS